MNRPLKKGPVSKEQLRNGEEVITFHRGKLKLIRKEFGKLFELEFSSPEIKELKTFAKHSDVRTPQKNAVKIIKEGVRVADDNKNLFATLPDTTSSEAQSGEAVVSSGNVIPK
jgi:hypothetical protein|tara:strand:+ start:471 stop:809 length:339 start_codon:yes stop_codon:yes gene_type:complete